MTRKTLTLLLFALAIVGMAIWVRSAGLEDQAVSLLQWIEQSGLTGLLLFGAVVSVSVVFLLPGLMFTLGAGFLLGVLEGSLLIVSAETIGATVAFYLGRFGREYLPKAWVAEGQQLSNAVNAVARQGWRFIALIRMIPFFPFKLSNYAFGLAPVTLPSYVLGTFVGLWPITLFNTYLGSLASNLVSLGTANEGPTNQQWVMIGVGFVFTVALCVILSRYAKAILQDLEQAH